MPDRKLVQNFLENVSDISSSFIYTKPTFNNESLSTSMVKEAKRLFVCFFRGRVGDKK